MLTKCYTDNLTGREHLEDLGLDRRLMFKWILKKEDVDV
jgi:hypothetical protein